jgi:hypothetical protein
MWHARGHIHPLASKETELEDLPSLDHEMWALENMSTVYPENEDSNMKKPFRDFNTDELDFNALSHKL